jgi:hypothetical protein
MHIKKFKQFSAELDSNKKNDAILHQIQLFEHEAYKLIPGTKNSYRVDSGNTNTKTIKHSHIYAKPKGKSFQLYSVSIDGRGHDGSSGTVIPSSHADYFRSLGYAINKNNILENLSLKEIDDNAFTLILIEKS